MQFLIRQQIDILPPLKAVGFLGNFISNIMTKKKETYTVEDYITFKTIFGLNEGRIVKVIDESCVSVNTIDGFDNYYVPVRDIEFKTAKIK